MSKQVFSRLCINHRNATPVEGCRVAPLSSEVYWHQDVTQIDPLSSQAASIACLTLVPCCAVRCRTALLAVGPRTRATAEGSPRGIFQQTWANQGPWATGSLQNTMPNITSEHAHLHHFRTHFHSRHYFRTHASLQNTYSSIPSIGSPDARSHSTLPQLLVGVGWAGNVLLHAHWMVRPVTPGKGGWCGVGWCGVEQLL